MPRANDPRQDPNRPVADDGDGVLAQLRLRLSDAHLRWGIGATVLILLATTLVWYLRREEGPEPHQLLVEALKRLDSPDDLVAWHEAAEAAAYLRRIGYRDPEFPGGAEYILGLVAFREAAELDETARDLRYRRIVRFLRDAESRALDAARRPELAFALGVSLYHVGPSGDARPLLEEAVATYEPGRAEAAVRLIDVYLDGKTPDDLERALVLSTSLLESPQRDGRDVDHDRLRQAQVLLSLGRSAEAAALLDRISPETAEGFGVRVLRARVLMAHGQFRAARERLAPVAAGGGLEQSFPRQAAFLMARCAEQLGEHDTAIVDYERAAKKYPESHEGVAANLFAGNLLRAARRNEEALAAYRRALRPVGRLEEFRNRWLTADEFRQAVLDAWNGWIGREEFAEAIALADLMPPLFPEAEALELSARAHQHWAESVDRQCAALPYALRAEREADRRRRWRATGRAYARMAEALQSTDRHAATLWQSAECFRKGHALDEALGQTDAFLAARPAIGLPLAMTRRGELLMDLDRQDEALESFWRVIAEHPSDPASFEARLLVARCQLERGRPDEAERALRAVLQSADLTPDAREWRMALFELGRLLCVTATMQQNRAELPPDGGDAQDLALFEAAFPRWDDAIGRLDEFLRRYSDAPEAAEARFRLAHALRSSAEYPRRKLQTAETENARQELARSVRDRLTQAADQFQRVRAALQPRDAEGRLDPVGRRLLTDAAFNLAHTYYALDDFEEAVRRYSTACNRYPRDPRVLLSYVQMSKCYERLGKPAEARSMLEQAKVILRELPAETFAARTTNFSRDEWAQWLDWAAAAIAEGTSG